MSIFVNDWAQQAYQINRENYKIHFIWFRIFIYLLVMMTVNRFVVMVSLLDQLPPANYSYLNVFWMGLRFDALILGFTYFLVLGLSYLRFFLSEEISLHAMIYLTRKYYFFIWTMISLAYYFNVWFVLSNHKHMRLEDWKKAAELKTYIVFQNFPLAVFGVVSIVLLVSFYLGFYQILHSDELFDVGLDVESKKEKFVSSVETLQQAHDFKESLPDRVPYWGQFLFFLLAPLLLVALVARGTLTPHHLGYEHSLISEHSLLNELVLNPVWTFDKTSE